MFSDRNHPPMDIIFERDSKLTSAARAAMKKRFIQGKNRISILRFEVLQAKNPRWQSELFESSSLMLKNSILMHSRGYFPSLAGSIVQTSLNYPCPSRRPNQPVPYASHLRCRSSMGAELLPTGTADSGPATTTMK